MDEQKENFEVYKNIGNFQLCILDTGKYTQNIFGISNTYEFLLTQYMEKIESSELSKLFNLEENNLLNLVSDSNK